MKSISNHFSVKHLSQMSVAVSVLLGLNCLGLEGGVEQTGDTREQEMRMDQAIHIGRDLSHFP